MPRGRNRILARAPRKLGDAVRPPAANRGHWLPVAALAACLLGNCFATSSWAEDADRIRPYLRFHSGDIAPLWGVDDLWSLGIGMNFNRYGGAELAFDYFERDFDYGIHGRLGEVSVWNLVPELRLCRPLLRDRLVPYAVAGVGPSFLQLNDPKSRSYGRQVDIEGVTLAVGAGAGLEYFVADNVTFGVEGKYLWVNPIEGWVDAQKVEVDLSSALFTFGLRVYFDENRPRPLLAAGRPAPLRFYFGLNLGAAVLTDDRWVPGVRLVPESSSVGILNQTGGLSLGLDFDDFWGIELAMPYFENGVQVNGIGTAGEYSTYAVIPQLRLRHALGQGRWVPYFVAGVGMAYSEFNDARPPGDIAVQAQGLYPALSVGAGVEYFVVRNFSAGADVRWLYTWDHELRIRGTDQGRGDYSAVRLTFGLRVYLFEWIR